MQQYLVVRRRGKWVCCWRDNGRRRQRVLGASEGPQKLSKRDVYARADAAFRAAQEVRLGGSFSLTVVTEQGRLDRSGSMQQLEPALQDAVALIARSVEVEVESEG